MVNQEDVVTSTDKEEDVKATEEVQETTTEEVAEPSPDDVTEPVYEPSYGYKVYDEEREFDDWAKDVLKAEGSGNKEVEDKLRDLYARSGAFDKKKEEAGEWKEKHSVLDAEHSGLNGEVDELMYYLKNDLQTFFEKLDIPKQRIYDYVQAAIDEEKLEPIQRDQLQVNRRSLVDSFQSGREADQLRAENAQLSQTSFNAELDRALIGQETVTFTKKFDELYGQGSFRNEVINTGRLFHASNGRDTTPLDAALQTIEKHRNVVDRLAPANELEAARKAQEEGKPKGHIPNVGGGSVGNAPIRKLPKTVEDFRKLANDRLEELKQAN